MDPTPDDRWHLDVQEVTMLRGVASVNGDPCVIDWDLTKAEATLTVKSVCDGPCEGSGWVLVTGVITTQPLAPCPDCKGAGRRFTRVTVDVEIPADVRQAVVNSLDDTLFYIGKGLRASDTRGPE